MKVIKKKRLLQMGFTQVGAKNSNEPQTVFDNIPFRVILVKEKKDEPTILIDTGNEYVSFPGAYTMKDLMDIIFFYLGEDECTKFTKNWTLPGIVKIYKPKLWSKKVNNAIKMHEYLASFISFCEKEHGINIPEDAFESFLDA